MALMISSISVTTNNGDDVFDFLLYVVQLEIKMVEDEKRGRRRNKKTRRMKKKNSYIL